jgi:hypothetical protein
VTILTISTIPTIAQTTASIFTTINSHLNGWETISHKDTSKIQHHRGWKTCTTLMTAWLSIINQVCVRIQNKQESKAPAQNWANQTVWFYRLRRQSGAPSALTRASFSRSSGVWPGRRTRSTTTQGVVAAARRSNEVKMRRKPKTRAKSVKKSRKVVIWLMFITIRRDLCIYRQQDVALWVRYD